jgi:hypothetical protein
VVVAGSLTNGYGLTDSDVDGFVIVTDEGSPVAEPAASSPSSPPSSATTRVATSMPSTSTGPSSKPSWSEAASSPVLRSWGDRGLVDRPVDRWAVHAASTYPEAGVEQRMARFLAQAQAQAQAAQ